MNDSGPILVVEPNPTGHRMTYVRWIVEGVLRAGRRAVIATAPAALVNPVLQSLVASERHRIVLSVAAGPPRISRLPGAAGLVVQQWLHYLWIRRAYLQLAHQFQMSGVVLPYVDICLLSIAVAGSPFADAPWVGITMRTTFLPDGSPSSRLRSAVLRRVTHSPAIRGLYCISPSLRQAKPGSDRAGLTYLPDPAEIRGRSDRSVARRRLNIAPDAFVVLVFGAINERKGVSELLAGASRLNDSGRLTIMIAGVQSPTIRALLATPALAAQRSAGRIVEIDGFLDDDCVADVLAAADAVWLGYVGHVSMSGVAVLAGHAGLPVLACSCGEIGVLTRALGVGPTVDVQDADAVGSALRELMRAESYASYASCAATAYANHTPAAFAATLLEPLLFSGATK